MLLLLFPFVIGCYGFLGVVLRLTWFRCRRIAASVMYLYDVYFHLYCCLQMMMMIEIGGTQQMKIDMTILGSSCAVVEAAAAVLILAI